ncbi:ATP15 ATP synthase subunit epsilon [Candida maltosa Xu316]|uniref:ATP synthase catalytic sector F1 epsilon subunit n=1 Tax=Candida maltosa (strain Xu316) TaxID=1245528 RepID=M3JDN2_CANMX|nr:ATP synthase catalytic sector F1 epsilon subunit [Candida maltosa Xu316]
MSAAKQAGITLNKSLAIAAQTLRNSLKPEFKAAAEKRGAVEAKVITFTDGKQNDPQPLKAIDN